MDIVQIVKLSQSRDQTAEKGEERAALSRGGDFFAGRERRGAGWKGSFSHL